LTQDILNVVNTPGLSEGEKAGYVFLATFIAVLATANIGFMWITERRR
jgi:hypothetical protein